MNTNPRKIYAYTIGWIEGREHALRLEREQVAADFNYHVIMDAIDVPASKRELLTWATFDSAPRAVAEYTRLRKELI